jgi:hypothetical protein
MWLPEATFLEAEVEKLKKKSWRGRKDIPGRQSIISTTRNIVQLQLAQGYRVKPKRGGSKNPDCDACSRFLRDPRRRH